MFNHLSQSRRNITIIFFIFALTGCQINNPFESSFSTSAIVSSEAIEHTSSLEDTISENHSFSSEELTSTSESINSSETSLSFPSSEEVSIASSNLTSDSNLSNSNGTSSTTSSQYSTSIIPYTGYYQALDGKSDAQVFSTLTTILRSILTVSTNLLPTHITYGNARYDIPKFDKDPNNPNHVILVYSQNSVNGTWDSGSTWNREHVFPQSLMGVSTENSSRHKGADYHNLKPENPSVNSSRGNKYFAESTTTTSYSPPSVVRGDIARILFYMVTMWPELSLVDVVSGDPATYTIGQLTLFVKWHLDDPVDAFESNRNEVIYGLQGNRNPYVDHEELVCRIWGNTNISTQGYCAA